MLHAAASQPYHTYGTVWDSKYPEDVERFATHGCSRLYPHVNGTAPVFPIAVSYTHLDVYKRQISGTARMM